ncbi:MAG: hypothetical protein ACJ8F1_25770 [Polyangia bacterium]
MEWVYGTSAQAAGYNNRRIILALVGHAVGHLSGSHVHTMSDSYVGELGW